MVVALHQERWRDVHLGHVHLGDHDVPFEDEDEDVDDVGDVDDVYVQLGHKGDNENETLTGSAISLSGS